MSKYSHLTLEERELMWGLQQQGVSLREIAKRLGRSHSSVSRELRRNAKYGNAYIPCKAQERSVKRGIKQRRQAPLKNTAIILYVREKLRLKWSPETIAGRLRIDVQGETIDDETIYRYIHHPRNRRRKLWRYLTRARKKRMQKDGRSVKRDSKIPDAVSIDKRPHQIQERKSYGHWESDNMVGKQIDKTVVSVSTERLTRLTILSKVSKKSEGKVNGLTYRLGVYPKKFRKTITVDNGAENTKHKDIKRMLNMNVYFCHAYHSWEKGTVENTIGRIRRYIPKGISIDELPEEYVQEIEQKINNTPRKCLNFLTPYEKKLQVLKKSIVY